MKKREVDHVLRAAGRITHEKQFIIVGSQSLHGRYPDLPDDIVRSAEVDLFAKNHPEKTDSLMNIALARRRLDREDWGGLTPPK
jgi:hypothetical protein